MGKRKVRQDAAEEMEETVKVENITNDTAVDTKIRKGSDSPETKAVIGCGENDIENCIEKAIISLINQRGCDKTCCPSEIPRLILKYPNWRDYMDLTRTISFRLASAGILEITQRGTLIDPSSQSTFTGIMRIRLPKTNVGHTSDST